MVPRPAPCVAQNWWSAWPPPPSASDLTACSAHMAGREAPSLRPASSCTGVTDKSSGSLWTVGTIGPPDREDKTRELKEWSLSHLGGPHQCLNPQPVLTTTGHPGYQLPRPQSVPTLHLHIGPDTSGPSVFQHCLPATACGLWTVHSSSPPKGRGWVWDRERKNVDDLFSTHLQSPHRGLASGAQRRCSPVGEAGPDPRPGSHQPRDLCTSVSSSVSGDCPALSLSHWVG